MNAIVGFSEFLKLPDLELDKRIEYIDIISNNCFQLLDIIDSIIISSSLVSGKVDISTNKTDLSELFNSLLSDYRDSATAKGISLSFEINGVTDSKDQNNVNFIETDRNKLREIFCHLLNNAIKFTKSGYVKFGSKVVSDDFMNKSSGKVSADGGADKKGKQLLFYVSDSGIGIAQENQKHIFDRFSQADSSIRFDYGGTGLGLSIAKGYVELLGGKIWVESKAGKGSTFYFTV
jgi:signal transduction histidine kinase